MAFFFGFYIWEKGIHVCFFIFTILQIHLRKGSLQDIETCTKANSFSIVAACISWHAVNDESFFFFLQDRNSTLAVYVCETPSSRLEPRPLPPHTSQALILVEWPSYQGYKVVPMMIVKLLHKQTNCSMMSWKWHHPVVATIDFTTKFIFQYQISPDLLKNGFKNILLQVKLVFN